MILAIDTSTTRLGLAVYNGLEVLGEITWTSPNRHTEVLAPSVQSLLETLEIPQSKLKALSVAVGPGSFTSLRVGLSFAKGMSLGLGIPVIGVPTLDIIAAQQSESKLPLCAFLQAGRSKLAAAFYEYKRGTWSCRSDISVYTIETLAETVTEPTILCGEFSGDMRAQLRRLNKNLKIPSPAMNLRRPGFLAELGWKIYEKGDYPPVSELKPIYLHTAGEPIPE